MSPMELDLFVTQGLGDTSYLLASGREAVLVDPQRDAWRFVEATEKRGVRIVRVLETHVHNDYLSGALEVRAATGAEIVAPARGGYEFAHHPADEGDSVELGGYRLTAMATPGHTPEHLAWLVTAYLIATAALAREESRGAHLRLDFPQRDPTMEGRHVTLEQSHDPALENWS